MPCMVKTEETTTPSLRARVLGMDCGSCALAIEDGVRKLPGVTRVSVDFTTEIIEVSGTVSADAVAQRVQQLGYRLGDASLPATAPAAPDATSRGFFSFLWSQRRQRVAIVAAAALLLVLALRPEWSAWAMGLAVLVVGAPLFIKGLRALLFGRSINIELLMTLAAIGALWIGASGEAAAIVLLFTLGEALEGYSAARARDSLRSLIALQPQSATVLRAHAHCEAEGVHDHAVTIPAAELVRGDRMLVKPGERIAADGIVRVGSSSVDQAAVTGESIPVAKSVGDEVLAGSVNFHGTLEVEVTERAMDSTLARIAKLVEQAQAQRSPAERFIDRFARWYTPSVVLIAALLVLIPVLAFGQPLLDSGDERGWLYRGLALLIVACPCALIISIPVTVVSSLTRLARLGVLVKGGEQLDKLADVQTIAFDKTGTLTRGRPEVTAVVGRDCVHTAETENSCAGCDEVIAVAASVERGSEHPIAKAIVDWARKRGLVHRYPRAQSILAFPGQGVVGELAEERICVGTEAFMQRRGVQQDPSEFSGLHGDARTVAWVARGTKVIGAIGIDDPPRTETFETLQELRNANPPVKTVMLTGDNPMVAKRIAESLGGVDEIRAGLLPADKLEAVASLQSGGGTVAMVGDGINDAPALARADVGIAMGHSGTAQAMETADVVLMNDDLRRVPLALRIARKNRALVKQNIALSLGLKLAFLVLASSGFATLWLAVGADVGATLLVTINGMRMLKAA